jgi:hypothetical protein
MFGAAVPYGGRGGVAREDIKRQYIVATDFGTTRSTIAHTTFDPTQMQTSGRSVHLHILGTGADSTGQEEGKVDTILVMREGEPDQIGYRCLDIASSSNDSGYYARDFKMLLDVKARSKTEGTTIRLKDTMVTLQPIRHGDPTSRMPLFEVIQRYIKVAGDIGFAALTRECVATGVPVPSTHDVHWIVTVPAIWTDQARIFMREVVCAANLVAAPVETTTTTTAAAAASSSSSSSSSAATTTTAATDNIDAGTTFTDKIGICLEPEGAALAVFSSWKGEKTELRDKKLLIIDLGGGTADITLHRIAEYARMTDIVQLEELEPPSGGDWGGRLVLRKFEDTVLRPLLGSQWQKYETSGFDRLRVLKSFEDVIRSFTGLEKRNISIPNLLNIVREFIEITNVDSAIDAVNRSLADNMRISMVRSTLSMPVSLMRSLFDAVLEPLREHLTAMLARVQVDLAFLVGGMGSNQYVINNLADFMAQHANLQFIPAGASSATAIATGAVRFGYDSSAFGLRVARTHYGIKLYNTSDPTKHLFGELISKGANLKEVSKRTSHKPLGPYVPLTADQTQMCISLYECDQLVKYTKDAGCAFITEIIFSIDTSVPMQERECTITLCMDGPVITGKVLETSSGKEMALKWSSR